MSNRFAFLNQPADNHLAFAGSRGSLTSGRFDVLISVSVSCCSWLYGCTWVNPIQGFLDSQFSIGQLDDERDLSLAELRFLHRRVSARRLPKHTMDIILNKMNRLDVFKLIRLPGKAVTESVGLWTRLVIAPAINGAKRSIANIPNQTH